jgi:hypothetical protein
MDAPELSGLLVQPIAQRVGAWLANGKLDEDDLDATLSSTARGWLDHSIAASDWAPQAELEELVAIAAEQLGGEAGLVEWADDIVSDWLVNSQLSTLVSGAQRLVDGPGFIASQAGEQLLRSSRWTYEGSSGSFSVRLEGAEALGPALKALLGACLARLAAEGDTRAFDVRFEGVDDAELIVFGELDDSKTSDEESQVVSRLYRAALIP